MAKENPENKTPEDSQRPSSGGALEPIAHLDNFVVPLDSDTHTSGKIKRSPVLKRHHVYCQTSFKYRVVDWFGIEAKRLSAKEVSGSSRKQQPGPPTRIQPSRAAKRKAEEAPSITRMSSRGGGTYALSEDTWSEATRGGQEVPSLESIQSFQGQVLDAINARLDVIRQKRGEKWLSGEDHKCGILSKPLSCTEMAYCLHGYRGDGQTRGKERRAKGKKGKRAAGRRSVAPVADMMPSPTLGNWKLYTLKEEDLDGQTAEVGGLRFAVDTCSGSVKIVMM